MTESEWLAATALGPMLGFLSGKASERKLLLFAAGCHRLVWALLPNETAQWVEGIEQHADGLPTRVLRPENLTQGEGLFDNLTWRAITQSTHARVEAAGIDARDAAGAASGGMRAARARDAARVAAAKEHAGQCCGLLRCLFHPFRPLPPLGEAVLCWDEGLVGKMATAIDDERDFSPERMGVLADALEEAGVTDAELLGHLRGPGPHCRGCFALDAVLGKS
jgi:hypothetical protein